ncbi:hypothetical protein J2Y58_003939 [Sphingomonas sp. BE138]|uniref:hypothetical protein n=1 Tax=Sphingomonas sp. BE138 TaxID=2817845 RepID=UPI00286393C9|nr:hypothetical protein [Sphingomonas sp. BE138]MDR6790556.1 hypothetical protein [Sphingomonas sp. BE138]
MIRKSALLACVLALANAAPAFAGPIPQPYYFPNGSRGVKINYALPAACDANTKAAVDTINAAGRSFQLTGTTQNYTSTYYSATEDPDFINIQDGSSMSAIMRTIIYGYSGPAPAQAIDATVYVNTDRIYYDTGDTAQSTDLICGSSITSSNIGQHIDWQSAMTHEMGHLKVMDHRTDGSTGPCSMTTYLNPGQIKRSLCSDERALLVGFYG